MKSSVLSSTGLTKMLATSLLFFVFVFTTQTVSSQPPANMEGKTELNEPTPFGGDCVKNIPDLTDEQQKQIEKLQLSHQKAMLTLRNQLGEKKAQLRTLQTVDNADINAINKKIDEISVIKTDMAKKQAAHQQDIRKQLTDSQRLYFDTHRGGRFGKGDCYGRADGRGKGKGRHGRGQRQGFQDVRD